MVDNRAQIVRSGKSERRPFIFNVADYLRGQLQTALRERRIDLRPRVLAGEMLGNRRPGGDRRDVRNGSKRRFDVGTTFRST
jgi:hypothetical protein